MEDGHHGDYEELCFLSEKLFYGNKMFFTFISSDSVDIDTIDSSLQVRRKIASYQLIFFWPFDKFHSSSAPLRSSNVLAFSSALFHGQFDGNGYRRGSRFSFVRITFTTAEGCANNAKGEQPSKMLPLWDIKYLRMFHSVERENRTEKIVALVASETNKYP